MPGVYFTRYPMADPTDTRSPAPPAPGGYDPRYAAGVRLFNAGEYFEAHEVWEDVWMDCPAWDRRFYQSLIQAAVALYHWGNRNRAGSRRLFHSGRRYMRPYRPSHRGLDVDRFWEDMAAALAVALDGSEEPNPPSPCPAREGGAGKPPRIVLDPPPEAGQSAVPHNDGVRHE